MPIKLSVVDPFGEYFSKTRMCMDRAGNYTLNWATTSYQHRRAIATEMVRCSRSPNHLVKAVALAFLQANASVQYGGGRSEEQAAEVGETLRAQTIELKQVAEMKLRQQTAHATVTLVMKEVRASRWFQTADANEKSTMKTDIANYAETLTPDVLPAFLLNLLSILEEARPKK